MEDLPDENVLTADGLGTSLYLSPEQVKCSQALGNSRSPLCIAHKSANLQTFTIL